MTRPVFSSRNLHQWRDIASFLDAMPKRIDAAAPAGVSAGAAAPAALASTAIIFGGCVAPCTAVPDGNHGDNFEGGRA